MDMVGRNRDDKGSKKPTRCTWSVQNRISTEFHNVSVDANSALSKPLKLDYEMNDPTESGADLLSERSLQLRGEGVPIVF
jgi:hypothetical protein